MIHQPDPYQQDNQHRQLKAHLVAIRLRALAQGEMAHVQLVTMFLRSKGLRHV